jgi:CRP-like cAMP-binding protein
MLDGLPPELRTDVLMMIHRPSIIKVPLFARFHESFTQMMVRGLERHLCLPGTVLFKEGDRGDRLYLLHQGALEVLESWAGDAPVALMKEGALFGETAIISPELSHRSATVRALDRSIYYSLTRQHMADILVYFPEVRAVLESEARRLLEASTRSRKIVDNAGGAENLMLTLTVDVLQARYLPAADANGLADPYCQLRVDGGDEQHGPSTGKGAAAAPAAAGGHEHEQEAGGQPSSPRPHKAKTPARYRTAAVKKNLAPKWRETFYFKVRPGDVKPSSGHPANSGGDAGGAGRTDADDGAWLNITVWDQDVVGRDDMMGVVDIPLRNIPLSALQAQHLWFPINCSEKATKHATDSALTGGTKRTADTRDHARPPRPPPPSSEWRRAKLAIDPCLRPRLSQEATRVDLLAEHRAAANESESDFEQKFGNGGGACGYEYEAAVEDNRRPELLLRLALQPVAAPYPPADDSARAAGDGGECRTRMRGSMDGDGDGSNASEPKQSAALDVRVKVIESKLDMLLAHLVPGAAIAVCTPGAAVPPRAVAPAVPALVLPPVRSLVPLVVETCTQVPATQEQKEQAASSVPEKYTGRNRAPAATKDERNATIARYLQKRGSRTATDSEAAAEQQPPTEEQASPPKPAVKEKGDQQAAAAADAAGAMAQEHARAMEQQETEHEQELAQQSAEHERVVEEARAELEHAHALSKLAHGEALAEKETEHEQELAQQSAEHERVVEQVKAELEHAHKLSKLAHSEALTEQETEHERPSAGGGTGT